MSEAAAPQLPAERQRFTLLLLLLFAGSGCAALIYEVVWFHLLRLVIGGTALSLGCLLGSFMGGMCLGSLLLPRWVSPRRHPLRVYALLEVGIAGCGLVMPLMLPWLGRLYAEQVGAGSAGVAWRAALCAIALLLPTALMGATLPAIARWLDTTPKGIAALGRFYGANILGAILGTLLAGFHLLRVYDTNVATQVAAVLNGVVAAVALLLSCFGRYAATSTPTTDAVADPTPVHSRRLPVHVAIALSGCTALGAEVLWTRQLSLLFGASVYTFSLILAVFLLGLGIGSSAGARLAGRTRQPHSAFAICQLLLVPALIGSAWMIVAVIPHGEPTHVFQAHVYQNPLVRLPWDFVRCTLAILPAPILWGMSFPLALAAAGAGSSDAGRLVGGVYAANTIGAIAGALGTGAVLQLVGGSPATLQLLLLLALATTLLLVATSPEWRWWLRVPAALLLLLLPVALLAKAVPELPPGMIAYGRHVDSWDSLTDYLYVAEGTNASVAVTHAADCLQFHVSGKVVASTGRIDMRLQRMLGHLPALVHGHPRSVLIVGCGAGVTAGTFVDYPSIRRIVVCELEPKVVEAARQWLGPENHGVLDDPRTEIVLDDARHFLATTREKFDIITSDPIHPWVRGAAALYSREYHELVQQHLEPGAVVTQWVPLYQADLASVKSQIGTFFDAFPDGTVWSSDLTERGYDVVLMAQQQPMRIDVAAIDADLRGNALVQQALAEVDLGDAIALLRTFAGHARDLQPWLIDAQRNTDTGLRLQYLAGLALDRYDDAVIYADMKRWLRFPEGVFVADAETEQRLRQALVK